jgi:predicted transcriptional regulator
VNDPININSRNISSLKKNQLFEKAKVLDALEKDIISHWDTWTKFQQVWTNNAYMTFKDLDKYLVMIYLVRDSWQSLSDKFIHMSMDQFYELEYIVIEKINLITISSELNIPKETIRRKINELQKDGILKREGKQIILDKTCFKLQKPLVTLEILSKFIKKKSDSLKGEKWFGDAVSQEVIKKYITKYFTIMWLRFFKLQIPLLIRQRNIFTDLETYVVWGNVAMNHQYHLSKANQNNLVKEINLNNYIDQIYATEIKIGINASSIADISGIPRATVLRKLKWLVKEKAVKRNKKVEYAMLKKGKINMQVKENFKFNQMYVAEFLTDIFDYIKNSNFKT